MSGTAWLGPLAAAITLVLGYAWGQRRSRAAGPDPAHLRQVQAALRNATATCATLEAELRQSRELDGLGRLAGGVAHDLNNVLGAILSLASGPRAGLPAADPLAPALDAIIGACHRGRGVLGAFLRQSRREPEPREPVDLNAVVREVTQLAGTSTLKGLHVCLDLEEPLPPVLGDPGTLSNALLNLCVNARDAMADGGLLIIRTGRDGQGRVRLSVRDTGCGMPEAVAARATEAYFTTKPAGKGTGLGLALVAGTMKAHDGTLELVSQAGEGTEATLAFPALETRSAAPRRALRVLMVDDDEVYRRALCALLESHGHEVRGVAGGLEALQLVRDGLEVDLVLLDLNMPGLSGAETLQRLLDLRPGQPVLVSSGQGDPQLTRFLDRYPSAASIQKPFNLELLEQRMAELQELSRTGA